jgi:MOSC domain-containing protein YiiM
MAEHGIVVAVGSSAAHTFSKATDNEITLLEGLGVAGDAHAGVTVKHRSRVARDPTQPNLRQVHLMHAELFDELSAKGYDVGPGQMGENITTRGVPLLALPVGTQLRVGASAVVRLTGLRNPCTQLDKFKAGLMTAVLDRGPDGQLIRKAGVMSVVVAGGVIRAGDAIRVELPSGAHRAMEPV